MKAKYIYIIVMIVVLASVYFIFKDKILKMIKRGNQQTDKENSNNSTTIINQTKKTYNSSLFPLKRGDKGEIIKELQELLNKKLPIPYQNLSKDGSFGSKTEAALILVTGKKTITEKEFERLKSPFS